MRILAVTPAYPPQIGGIETVVKELSLRLVEMGHVVHIAHVCTLNKQFTEEHADGLVIYRVPLIGNRLLGLAPKLGEVIKKGYDVLHVHDPQLMSITANVRYFAGRTPLVLSTHGGFNHTSKHRLVKRIFEATALRRVLRNYSRILASSTGDLDYFRRYSDDVVECENGVDTSKYTVNSSSLQSNTRWIYWGRLSRNKRIDLVLQTLARAKLRGHSIKLLICGRDFDNLGEDLRKQAIQLGLETDVTFVDFMSHDELIAELAVCGLFITASEHEGFGLSIVEAMSAGLHIACRDIEPINRFITHGVNGFHLRFDGSTDDDRQVDTFLCRAAPSIEIGRACSMSTALRYDWKNAALRFEQNLLGSAR